MLRLPAIKVQQGGKTLYFTVIKAGDLINRCVIDSWDPAKGWDIEEHKEQGYQRAPIPSHYESIARFLANEHNPFLPTSALLSAREGDYGKLNFKPDVAGTGFSFGELTIPDGRYLHIVDYQHRWKGFERAIGDLHAGHLADFPVPTTIVADMTRPEEMLQFYLINSKQRRIKTDLALVLLRALASQLDEQQQINLVGGLKFRIRATRLTVKLVERTNGPWAGRIQLPHDLPQPNASIKITSFVDSLNPIVSRRNAISRLADDEIIDLLVSYWEGIASIMPAAFKKPKDYSIQRTTGVYAFHIILARKVYPILGAELTPSAVQKLLQPTAALYINETFWATKGQARIYTGSSGYRELASLIMGLLP